MNVEQAATAIRTALRAATWPDAPAEAVFGAVHASPGVLPDALGNLRFPYALVNVGQATVDDEAPDLLAQTFEVVVVVHVQGDLLGEATMLGAGAVTGSSQGRGILQVEERVQNAIERLSGPTLRLVHRATSETAAASVEGLGIVAERRYTYEAWLSRQTE